MESKLGLQSWKRWLTIVCRVIVGCTFILSGFVKAIDPWGSIYKIQEYIAALGIDAWGNLLIVAVFLLCSVEFVMGLFLILGCYRRLATVSSFLLVLVMLPLTLWTAIAEPVSDCGCFGDAFIIPNWATFVKNIVLMAMVVWLLLYNHRIRCLVIPELHWIVFILSALYINVIGLFGYIYQPLLDFRPYKIGESIIDFSESGEDDEFEFIYTRNGEIKSFSIENVPQGDDWQFVERKKVEKNKETDVVLTNKQLSVYDDNEEVTNDVILDRGEQMILFYPSLSNYSIASTYQINALQEYCSNQDIDMIAIVAGSNEEISEFADLSMASYPIYTSEDTSIKEIVRGSPAIVYLKDGVVVWKSSLRAINNDSFMSEENLKEPAELAFNNAKVLNFFTSIYIGLILFLVVSSHTPSAVRYIKQRMLFKKFTKESVEDNTNL